MKVKLKDYNSGDFIRIIREWTGLKQEDFAKTINRSTRSVQDYEAGITKYSMNMLLDIAKKHNLKITIEKWNNE